MSLSQQSLKQRVNMVVMRMIAQNSDQDHRAPREEVGGRGEGGRLPGGPYQPPHLQGGPGESREAVKQRVVGVTRVVVNPRESMGLVEELLRAGQVGGGVIVTTVVIVNIIIPPSHSMGMLKDSMDVLLPLPKLLSLSGFVSLGVQTAEPKLQASVVDPL